VEKGDLLFTYQSAELMSAQSDYLLQEGDKFSGIDPGLRLRLYGMEKKAIERLEAQGGMLAETPFHAPASSTLQSLNVREGAYVKKGATVLTLQDYSRVWIEADVPVRDLQFLTEGQKATVIVPQTGKRYITRIDLIRDTVDPTTRTGRVRLVVEQDKHRLRPGTYVDVEFSAYVEKRLAVPMEAVLYGGDGAIVIESLGEGRFRPVEVETGITARGYTEITDGLKAGRDIVKTGQFMIDAESNLRGGMAEMDGHSEQNDTMKKQGENGHDH
jgi:Cu(I)/Ag(I) efflux system membrane fusion protein